MKNSKVEYVICPLIFQYRVTMVNTHVETKMANVIWIRVVSFTRNVVSKKSSKYPMVVIVK